MPLYMVIETFLPGCLGKAYARFYEKGRMQPDGLEYVDSWLEKDGNRCFQLMRTDDRALFREWLQHWDDVMACEIIEIGEKPKP